MAPTDLQAQAGSSVCLFLELLFSRLLAASGSDDRNLPHAVSSFSLPGPVQGAASPVMSLAPNNPQGTNTINKVCPFHRLENGASKRLTNLRPSIRNWGCQWQQKMKSFWPLSPHLVEELGPPPPPDRILIKAC